MAGNRGRCFIGVGLLVGWMGTGCGNSDPRDVSNQEEAPAPDRVPGDVIPDPVSPGEEPDESPVQEDPGTQPEQPGEEPPPPVEPAPAGCEVVPSPSPEALAVWKFAEASERVGGTCGLSDVDDAGNVIQSVTPRDWQSVGFRVFYPDGSDWWGSISSANTMMTMGQSQGFLGLSVHPLESTTWITFLDTKHKRVIQSPPYPEGLGRPIENPAGGFYEFPGDGTIKAYGATGDFRWSVSLESLQDGSSLAVGVNSLGHILSLSLEDAASGTAQVKGVWVDASSGQLGASFPAFTLENGGPRTGYGLTRLLRGGLVLSAESESGVTWVAAFNSLQTVSAPVPAWLSDGDMRPFELLPGEKGYYRWGASRYEVQLTAPSGEACGVVRLPPMETGGGPGAVKMGRDGTIVETLPEVYNDGERPWVDCRTRWWPALFR